MSNAFDWLIGLALLLVALKLFFSLCPRWLAGALLTLVFFQVLHPSVSQQTIGAFIASPLLLIGGVLFGLWLILARGSRPGKKR
jgi:uncharacterized membrane protein YedE/YeeE